MTLADYVDVNLGFAATCAFGTAAAVSLAGAQQDLSLAGLVTGAGAALEGLVANQRSWFEDFCLLGTSTCTFFALYKLFAVPRKDSSAGTTVHVLTGGGAFLTSLYAIGLERAFRLTPGWGWCWASAALYTANALSWFPLMKIFRGSDQSKMAFYLAYSFVVSFQGIQLIAYSAQPDAPGWMYWAVMPFWWWSLRKLGESADFILALLPEDTVKALPGPAQGLVAGSKGRIKQIKPDTPTLIYTGLNLAAALFDNAYMGVFTFLGPEQFWHTSMAFSPNDFHLRLIKPNVGSLTVSVLVFLSTIAYRRQMPWKLIIWLNVILGSSGPWVVLLWHKILDWENEIWFPQFVFDPDFAYSAYLPTHLPHLG